MGALDAYFTEAAENPADWLQFSSEFFQTLDTGMWETVKDSGASAAIVADSSYGNLALTSAATTENDGALVQSNQEFVLPTVGKRIVFSCYVKNSDADQSDVFMGLAQAGATDPESILAVSNAFGFYVLDGNASILCKSKAADVETSIDSQVDLADNTYVLLEMFYDGVDRIVYYVNGLSVGAQITTNIPATELGLAMFSLSGSDSGTRVTTIDFVRLAVER